MPQDLHVIPTLICPDGRPVDKVFRLLSESPEFLKYVQILKNLTGLAMTLSSPDNSSIFFVKGTEVKGCLCEVIKSTPDGDQRCQNCILKHQNQVASQGKPILYKCHAGFYDVVIPIIVQGRHVASIFSGQVLPERPSAADLRETAKRLKWLKVPHQQFKKAYQSTVWMPKQRLADIMNFLETFATQLCENTLRILELEEQLTQNEIRKAKELIEEKYKSATVSRAHLARQVGLSPGHFSHLFHQETGMTFTRYVQTRRVNEAKHLLQTSDKNITEICFECGFNNLTHFNRVFRSFESKSPRQYRSSRSAANAAIFGEKSPGYCLSTAIQKN